MEFKDNTEEATFRTEVRDFIKSEISPELKDGSLAETGAYRGAFERMKGVRQKLASRGWIAAAWPKEYGGAGLSVMQQFIMNEEFAEARAPQVGGMGTSMIGPTLIIWCTAGVSGIVAPAIRAIRGLQTPQAMKT